MLGKVMITAGFTLIVGTLAAAYHLMSKACAANAAVCEASLVRRISDLMIANEGFLFWLVWVAAVFLIWGGTRIKSPGKAPALRE